ncbi:MAG TPA: WXG100 family type VII secretion target [Actinomycetales bacterium]|nr:WXG100 family type VII secretion target [Actinomycetales bacterium]
MKFEVDAGEVERAANRVSVSADAISHEVESMMSHLNELQGTWRGSAAASFQELAAQWRGTQAQVEESLQSIRQALNASAQQYVQAEEAALRMFAG